MAADHFYILGVPQSPLASLRDSPRLASRSSPVSYQISAFDLGPRACEILGVSFMNEVCFPPIL